MDSTVITRPLTGDREVLQVADTLREQIVSGAIKPGQLLPPERTLTHELRSQRRIVRAAIEVLKDEGFLSKKWNCRPIVQSANGYDPEHAAQEAHKKVRFSTSRLVALVMWHGGPLEQQGTAQQRIFWGMNQELGKTGYLAVFMDLGANVGTEKANAEREREHLRYALDHNFGGIVFYPYAYGRNHDLVKLISNRMPLIVIDRKLPGIESDYVGLQNQQAMAYATAHLIGLGHNRIAYVTKNEPINTVQDRLQGYLQGLDEHFGCDAYEMVIPKPSMLNKNWPAFDIIFGLGPKERPSAVLCVNDYDAVHVVRQLKSLGLEVPRDVSVIGCDNLVKTLDTGVGLTSLAQPFEQIGVEAAKLFLRRAGASVPGPIHIELPAQFICRDSCAPAPEF